ncbi:hypothetical protein P43SY_002466 [Pythium insidiosum]|uniref:VPS37 C-terminal domain-containing protein n=1 Tax=Pythium insidiosum TaxID=114742 RepID=A0AAD5Q430_PYTIN|nr:hypothetical protein P43SY_002466 [Pythium insidiosum]
MSFFFRQHPVTARPSAQETQQSELERLRGRQLASLVRAGGRAKNHQQTTFEVPVTDTQRGQLLLILTLPTEFPMKPPHIQITAELRRHAAAGASSAKQATPPPPPQQAYASQYQYPAMAATSQPPVPKPEQPKLQRSQMPTIPSVFPELDELPFAQLETLSADRHALKAFVKKIHTVQEFTKLREDVMTGNMGIAEKTLSYEEKMRQLQAEVRELSDTLRTSQQALAEKQMRQQRVVARHRPDALLEQLSAAAQDVDSTSDDIAHKFTHGEIDFQTFIAEYLPQRTLYHERTIKLGKVMQH